MTQVDGFRFDIMSCLMVSTMEKARDALRALTVDQDGIDGASLYFYGEGWDFGEVRCEISCRSRRLLRLACSTEPMQRTVPG